MPGEQQAVASFCLAAAAASTRCCPFMDPLLLRIATMLVEDGRLSSIFIFLYLYLYTYILGAD